jgi:CheY-like chemotaxis protein
MDKHHILVVDDNHINRLFFESSLKKLNLNVSLAENGFKAIELCQQQSFALILMDIRMDGLDGVQTAAAIKSLESNKNTTILAVSAESFDIEQHIDFANSLLKPISQDDLKLVLTQHLSDFNQTQDCFDDALALQISHQDLEIVNKLRYLLAEQLPADWILIEQLYKEMNWISLHESLHKLLGSAKICAATLLIQSIEQFKSNIESEQSDGSGLLKLKDAIDKTIHATDHFNELG